MFFCVEMSCFIGENGHLGGCHYTQCHGNSRHLQSQAAARPVHHLPAVPDIIKIPPPNNCLMKWIFMFIC